MKVLASQNDIVQKTVDTRRILDCSPKKDQLTQVVLDVLKDTAVTIYHNTSQFSDYFTAKITSPETELCYQPVLFGLGANKNFIHLDEAKGEIATQISSIKQFNLSGYFNSLVGKQVVLHTADGELEGKLLGNDGQKFTLLTQGNQGSALAFVARDKVSFIFSEGLDQAMDVKPYYNAKYVTDKSPEDIKGQMIFINHALKWSAEYRLIVEETQEGLKGRWVAEATITNSSQIDLKDLMVKVVGGDLNETTGGNPGPQPCFNEMRAMCASSAPKAAIEQSWQDLKAFLIPHRVSLKSQETLSTRLYDPQDVSLAKRYVLHSYEHQNAQKHPNVCYHLDNSLEGDLGHAYPRGEVRVYRREDSLVNFIGRQTLNQTPKGEDLDIVTGESFDLMTKRESSKVNIRDDKGKVIGHEVTVKVELTNSSDEDQSVFLHEHIYGDVELLNTSLPISKRDSHELLFKVDVAKNTVSKDPVIFSYKYRKDIN
ncbi:MAG: hypothetical protein S4CHLAM6_08410 [Chlamydiae bacterium]|nr:hypothetical protein [Chlamydiota bacterium]